MSRPARALIYPSALAHNLAQVRRHAPGAKVMAVIKALADADAFGVASLEEALAIRKAVPADRPLCLLEGFFSADELPLVAQHGLHAVVHSGHQVVQLESWSGSRPIPVWLKIDTGMHRLGFPPEELGAMLDRLRSCPNVSLVGLLSHLADADVRDSAATWDQIRQFRDLASTTDLAASLANSAGVLAWPDSHFDWVRPGLMLFGASPLNGRSAAELDLQPAMQVESALIAIHRYRRGERIGYGGTWECPEDMAVGVVAFGYGDGYPRNLPAGTPLLVNGVRVPLIGRVSMDMITVDLRPLREVQTGDRVVLWGEGLPIDEIAALAGTIPYELMCRVADRVPRVPVDEEADRGAA
jgi:alanine racemase